MSRHATAISWPALAEWRMPFLWATKWDYTKHCLCCVSTEIQPVWWTTLVNSTSTKSTQSAWVRPRLSFDALTATEVTTVWRYRNSIIIIIIIINNIYVSEKEAHAGLIITPANSSGTSFRNTLRLLTVLWAKLSSRRYLCYRFAVRTMSAPPLMSYTKKNTPGAWIHVCYCYAVMTTFWLCKPFTITSDIFLWGLGVRGNCLGR